MLCRPISKIATAAFLLTSAVAASTPAVARTAQPAPVGPVLVNEAKSKVLCEAQPNRIFVTHFVGTECIAFYASPGKPKVDTTVLYFNGDIPAAHFSKPGFQESVVEDITKSARFIAEHNGVRIILIARPGTLGSSGDHTLRGERREMLIMNAAVDAIKERLGLTKIVVAGQSRGSQVAAVLLSMGREDISCAVLGSGTLFTAENEKRFLISKGEKVSDDRLRHLHQRFYDPSDYVTSLPKSLTRRVFILGDRGDVVTPWDQQMAYGNRLRELGHHASIIEITALGSKKHGATHMVLPTAAMCARDLPDERIEWIVAAPPRSIEVDRTLGM